LRATDRRWFPDTAEMSVGPEVSGVVALGSLQSFVVWAREPGPIWSVTMPTTRAKNAPRTRDCVRGPPLL
jgi:hypothetical protein